MSGSRQHFVPRFLQKGFASHVVGDQVFTWVYRKGAEPFNPNVKNVGLESAFYTQGADTLADDLITDAEKSFSELVEELRTRDEGRISDRRLPALLAHLEIRTRHFRQNFLQSAEYLSSQLVEFIADGDSFVEYFERKLRNDPATILEMLSEDLAKKGLPPDMAPALFDLLPQFLLWHKPNVRRGLAETAVYLRRNLPDIVRKAAKSGHIKALKRSVSPEIRAQQYAKLTYYVVEVPDASLILGDSPVIFHVDASRSYKTFWEKDDLLKAIFLPVTPRRFLVGTYSGFSPSVSDLPQAIARCALEYFIAHEKSESNSLLKEHIGEDAYLLSKAQIEEIASQVFGD